MPTSKFSDDMFVSRETIGRLEIFEKLLRRWQSHINLVSAATLPDLWKRHFADSAQIFHLFDGKLLWADFGSGAGFPGLIIAILLADRVGANVELVETDQKKCAFLREVIRETDARATVRNTRIEQFVETIPEIEMITARALAPLPKLLQLAEPLLLRGAIGVFHKGRELEVELTQADRSDIFNFTIHPSCTSPDGRILVVQKRVAKNV